MPIDPVLPPLAVAIDWLPPTEDIDLYPESSRAIAPGSFGRVSVYNNSYLFLTAGDYQFEQLILESGSRFHLDSSGGPIRMFVKNTLVLRGQWIPPIPLVQPCC